MKIKSFPAIVKVEGEREGWRYGPDLSLCFLALKICLVMADNSDSSVITCSVLYHLCWFFSSGYLIKFISWEPTRQT